MLIVCDSCGAEYEVELDEEETLGDAAGVRFRCSACGHTFSVGGDRAGVSGRRDDWSEDPAVDEAAPEQPPMLLKQEGKVYQVDDVATLQRWIAERRVLREDLLSIGGLKWEPVGSRRDLQVFFQLVDTVEKAQGAEGAAAPPVEGAAAQDHGAVQGAAPWEVGAGQGPPVAADTSWIDPFAAPAADEDEWEDDEGTDAGLPVFGTPPVADEPDPTDLPDRVELPNLAALDAPEPTLEVPRHTPAEAPGPDAAEPGTDDPRSAGPAEPVDEPSVPSAASHASASDVAVPLPAAEPARTEPARTEPAPTETVSVEDRATEEVRRPADQLSEDMLFPEERESEGLPPVPVAGGLPAGLGDRDLYTDDRPEARTGGVPPWAVAAAVVLVLVAAWWFLGRGDGPDGAPAGEDPVAAVTASAEAGPADADATPPKTAASEAAASEAAASEAAAAEAPAAGAGAAEAAAAAATTSPARAEDAAGEPRDGAAALMPAPAPPEAPTAAEREAEEAAAREAAAREAAAREAAAREAAAREAAAREAAAREAAAREAASREAASPPPPRAEPRSAPAASVKQLVDRGWALVERGDLTGARASFSEALTKQPGSADARFGLGYAYEKLGNQAAAVRNYCQVASDGAGDAKIEAQGRLRALEASCE